MLIFTNFLVIVNWHIFSKDFEIYHKMAADNARADFAVSAVFARIILPVSQNNWQDRPRFYVIFV